MVRFADICIYKNSPSIIRPGRTFFPMLSFLSAAADINTSLEISLSAVTFPYIISHLPLRHFVTVPVSVFLPCRAFIRHRLFWFFHNRQPFFTCSITVFYNRSAVMHYILLNANTSIYRPLSVCRPNAFLTGIRRLQSCRQLRAALCLSRIIFVTRQKNCFLLHSLYGSLRPFFGTAPKRLLLQFCIIPCYCFFISYLFDGCITLKDIAVFLLVCYRLMQPCAAAVSLTVLSMPDFRELLSVIYGLICEYF